GGTKRRKAAAEASAGASAAESVERRAGAKGNTHQHNTYWTQSQARVTNALERIRPLSPSYTRGGSRMRESRTYGSVRGACDETHVPTATAPRLHRACRRRGRVAARGTHAAAKDGVDRSPKRQVTRRIRSAYGCASRGAGGNRLFRGQESHHRAPLGGRPAVAWGVGVSHEMMNSRERRLSSWSNATCAMPLCEALWSRRGRGPHHAQKDRVGSWDIS